jgi:tetratricopeptide (TPR) repeat protein
MRALTALQPTAAASDRLDSISELEQLRARRSLDRTVNIFLGRLYRMQGNYAGAVAALTTFLEAKQKNLPPDKDYADVLYNRACYLVLRSVELAHMGKTDEAATMKLRAYQDLETSIKLSPENKEDARHDVDLETLQGEAQFRALLGP